MEGLFILAHSLRIQPIMVGKACWQGHTRSYCICGQKAGADAAAQLALSSSFSLGPMSLSSATHIQGGASLLKTPPHGGAEVPLPDPVTI